MVDLKGWTVRLCGYALVWIALLLPATAFAADHIREMQRQLWVLGALEGTGIDGKDGPGFRGSLAGFASARNATIGSDQEAASLLARAIDEKRERELGPFENPLPFDRPSFSGDWVTNLVVDPQDNIVLAGSCDNIARFRLDTGLPLKSFRGGVGSRFVYSNSRKQIICLARWDASAEGLLIIDARTGMNQDFIVIPGLDTFAFSHLGIDGTGTVIWVVSSKGLWGIDLTTRAVRRVVSKLPDNLPQSVAVSNDGSLVAIEFSYGMNSGKKGFPKEIRTYDAMSGRQLSAVFGVEGLTLAPRGGQFLVRKDDLYEIRDTRTGKILHSKRLDGWFQKEGIVFTADGDDILFSEDAGDTGRAIYRWDLASGTVSSMSLIGRTGRYVRLSEERGQAYTIGSDGVFRYDLQTGNALTPPRVVERTTLSAAAVSPDGKSAAGIAANSAYLLDTDSGQVRHVPISDCTVETPYSLYDNNTPIGFASNRHLVLGCNNGSLKEFDVDTGELLHIGSFSDSRPHDLKLSSDGRFIAAIYSDYHDGKSHYFVVVAERNTGRLVLRKRANGHLSGLGFADGGKRILYGEGHFAVVVDIASGKRVARQELKLEMTKSGRTTNWYWGSVRWVIADYGADETLFSAAGVGGLIYSYARGKFTLRAGKVWASKDSVSGLATAGRVTALSQGELLTVQGQGGPAIGHPGAGQWTSRHAPPGGRVLALGAQPNGRFAVVTDVGGMLLYARDRSEPVVTTVLSANGNWLSRIDGGYFAGTRGAAENLFLAPSLDETITVDALFETLYRPDLVVAVASGTPLEQKAHDDAGIKTLLKDGLPPAVTIVSPPNKSAAEGETITVRATVVPSTGGIGRIEWRVNGIVRVVRAQASAGDIPRGKSLEIVDSLLLEPGENVIELSVMNAANGIASAPATTSVSWGEPGSSAQPRLFVLAVGANRYWDSRLSLNFATDDAREIIRGFKLAGANFFEDVKTWLVADEQATRQGIGLAFDDIAKSIRSTDVFVLFVAGHGKTVDGRYFFLPHDFKYAGEESIAVQGIGQDDWQDWMTRVATRKSLLMFDTCESGTLTLERMTRGFDRVAALDRLTRATGRSILAASSDDGPALEGFQGHGVFAYSVLEGLGVADANRTGLVHVTALASHVGARVPDLSYGKFGIRQVPQMKLIGEDFAIGKSVSALAVAADDFVPPQPTHVLVSAASVTNADGDETGDHLAAGALLRVVAEGNGRSEVARAGKRLGFVPSLNLAPMH